MPKDNKSDNFSQLSTDKKLDRLYNIVCTANDVAQSRHSDITQRLDAMNTRINNIDQRIIRTEQKNQLLTDQMKNMQVAINQLQQSQIDCDFLIRNVPEIEKDEASLLTIVQLILQEIKADVPYNIMNVKRIGKNNQELRNKNHRLILVQLNHKDEKNMILTAKKKVEPVTKLFLKINPSV